MKCDFCFNLFNSVFEKMLFLHGTPILLLFFLTSVLSDGINVDLKIYSPYAKNYTYSEFFTISDEQTKIDIENIAPEVGFLVVQVHVFEENVTLSTTSKPILSSSVTGTNVGLVWAGGGSSAIFYLLRNAKISTTVAVYLVINVYDENAPVPGGCNLTFDVPVAPYQVVTNTDHYIKVHSQPPSGYGISCDSNSVKVTMYHMYLPEYDNKNTTYFDAIRRMTTVENIRKHGYEVTDLEGRFKYGKLYSNYRGTGEVFAVIATYNGRSSAYVPAISYGCDLANWDTDCIGPVSDHWKVYCAGMLFTGLFICFFGHNFFKTTLFLMGLKFGIIITFIVISLEQSFTTFEKAMTSFILGACYGVFWVFLWWKFGLPLLSINLAFIMSGTIISSTAFYSGLADLYVFKNDVNFWVTFVCFIITLSLIYTPTALFGHIISCTVIGSYIAIASLNYYVGGNLQYIVINTFRRVVVKDFGYAVIDPPFQTVDTIHALLWISLVIFGCFVQIRHQRNKPPFPPNRFWPPPIWTRPTERTPLLTPHAFQPPEYV